MPIYHGTEFPEGTTEEEANQFLAEEGMGQGSPKSRAGTTTELQQIANYADLLNQIEEIRRDYSPKDVGPVNATLGGLAARTGIGVKPGGVRMRARLATLNNIMLRLRSGQNVTEPELRRLQEEAPNIYDPAAVFSQKLDIFENRARSKAQTERDVLQGAGVNLANVPEYPKGRERFQGKDEPLQETMLNKFQGALELGTLPFTAYAGLKSLPFLGKRIGKAVLSNPKLAMALGETAADFVPGGRGAISAVKALRRGRGASKAEAAAEDMAAVAKRAARKPVIPRSRTPAAQVESQPVRRSAIPKPRRPSGGPGFEVPGETAGKLRATQMLQERGYSLSDINEALRRIAAGE